MGRKPSKPHHEGADRPAAEPIASLNNEVLDFMRLVWALDHGLQSVSKRMRNELGVTGPQRVVVRMVGEYPGISAGSLAELLHLHPSTLTGVLDRLVQRGVLSREIDPADRRRALFQLTKLGKLYDSLHAGTVEEAIRNTLAKVAKADLKAARTVLAVLIAELHPELGESETPSGDEGP